MGREVRKVPKDWKHPVDYRGHHEPLYDDYAGSLAEFKAKVEADGVEAALEWYGGGPMADNYMPDWPEAERTHLMMYETCSEGTPISPAFETAEELARWLVDNNASSFGSMGATYEEWLGMIQGPGCAVGMVMDVSPEGTTTKSGVAEAAGRMLDGVEHNRGE